MKRDTYAIVTPARNEACYLPATIESVVGQSILPSLWVIVDDGSEDCTAAIATDAARRYPFVRAIKIDRGRHRDFASKVHAFRTAVDAFSLGTSAFIGNLDSDVSLPSDYYARILQAFAGDPALGVAGGAIWEPVSGRYKPRRTNRASEVAGAAMVMRTTCYLRIGGYLPLPSGGEDTAAQYAARRDGWAVQTIGDLPVMHHRPPAKNFPSVWSSSIRGGRQNGILGYSVLYFLMKVIRRILRWPDIIAGPAWAMGYLVGRIEARSGFVPKSLCVYIRLTQLRRLFHLVRTGGSQRL